MILQELKFAELFFFFQFLFEGMEESGSEGLDELVFSKKDTFLKVGNTTNLKKRCNFDSLWNDNSGIAVIVGCRLCVHLRQLLARQEKAMFDLWSQVVPHITYAVVANSGLAQSLYTDMHNIS